MDQLKSGGGWPAVRYAMRLAGERGWRRVWKAASSKNACKTCALGMGGQRGGMRNETGHWPEICKKSLQAIAADLQGGIDPKFFEHYGIDHLRRLSSRELESLGRLTHPLLHLRGGDHYRVISWDEAFQRIANRFKSVAANECFFYASGRSSNEAGFLLQVFARVFGTNNVNNCSYYCHQASGVGLTRSIGTGTATVVLDDVEHADLFFLIGGNPASNHPRLMRSLMNVRRRGGNVIVINPVKEPGLVRFRVPSDLRSLLFGSDIAGFYIQPHIGGDIAVLTGIAKAVNAIGAIDKRFIADSTEGWDAYSGLLEQTEWADIERASGVECSTLERAAGLYAAAHNVVFGWTMGITHHEHGVQNVQAIVNLALLRGMVGRPHAGLLPIRGHSNVQGIGSMGVTPALKQAVFERLQETFGIQLPTVPGLDTMGCMLAAERGDMGVGWCLGGNLYGSNPDSEFARRALSRLETLVYLNTTLNTGHAWGLADETIILPVLARDEEPEPTTQESMFNYVRMSDGGTARHEGPRHEVAVIARVAREVLGDGGPIDWRAMERHRTIRNFIARIIPGYDAIGRIDETKQEFQIGGRTLHSSGFPMESGKARFHAHPIPANRLATGQLRLMTVRSEGQFNTVVYEEEDIYRGQERRDVILMNRADIDRLGLAVDQCVIVKGPAGSLSNIRVREYDIRAGNALMYFPEANVLVPNIVDPASKTPAFKSVAVTIEAAESRALPQLLMSST